MRTEACNSQLGKTGHGCSPWIPGLSCVLFVCCLYIFLNAPAMAQEPEKAEAPAVSPSQEVKPLHRRRLTMRMAQL